VPVTEYYSVANHGASRLHHLREAARENPLQNLQIGFLRKAHQSERRQRLSAHGVHIAERVGRRDLSERVRVIDNRREEVHGLHERLVGRDQIHSGVVGMIEAD
jgi:hypothetical protein